MHHESQSPAFRRQWSTTVKMSKNTPKPGEDPEEETSPTADLKQEPPVPLQDEKEVLNQNYWSEYQKL